MIGLVEGIGSGRMVGDVDHAGDAGDLGDVSADSAFRDFFSHGGNYWVERFC